MIMKYTLSLSANKNATPSIARSVMRAGMSNSIVNIVHVYLIIIRFCDVYTSTSMLAHSMGREGECGCSDYVRRQINWGGRSTNVVHSSRCSYGSECYAYVIGVRSGVSGSGTTVTEAEITNNEWKSPRLAPTDEDDGSNGIICAFCGVYMVVVVVFVIMELQIESDL